MLFGFDNIFREKKKKNLRIIISYFFYNLVIDFNLYEFEMNETYPR